MYVILLSVQVFGVWPTIDDFSVLVILNIVNINCMSFSYQCKYLVSVWAVWATTIDDDFIHVFYIIIVESVIFVKPVRIHTTYIDTNYYKQ